MNLNFRFKHFITAGGVICFFSIVSVTFAHEWMAPKDAAEIQNPINLSEQTVSRGRDLFIENCAVCHGDKGEGLSAKETGLKKDTPNLTMRLRTHTDGDFFWKIQNGRDEMPSFKDDLSDNEIWQIIHFISKGK